MQFGPSFVYINMFLELFSASKTSLTTRKEELHCLCVYVCAMQYICDFPVEMLRVEWASALAYVQSLSSHCNAMRG